MGRVLINSAQKELSQVLDNVNEQGSKSKQFKSLVKTYLHINGIKPSCQPKDYSQFYDELVADEIEERSARVAQSGEKIEDGWIEQKLAPHSPSKFLI